MVDFGANSLENIVTGTGNIGIGANTLQYVNGVNGNTAIGNQGQGVNFSGAFNTSVGGASLIQIIAGSQNTGLGQATLQNLTDTVASLGAITPGSGYTDGTYGGVNLTTDHIYGFIAGNLTADIVVSGGVVTSCTIVLGRGVRNGAILTILASTAPAGLLTGAGFSVPVASVNVSANNTAVGRDALRNGYQASNNTALGNAAGGNATGSNNVFIGYQAGQNETGSNKLYIDNSNTATPLIGGDFTANTVTIGGTLTANSLITAGGTSNQFVKGDGSLSSVQQGDWIGYAISTIGIPTHFGPIGEALTDSAQRDELAFRTSAGEVVLRDIGSFTSNLYSNGHGPVGGSMIYYGSYSTPGTNNTLTNCFFSANATFGFWFRRNGAPASATQVVAAYVSPQYNYGAGGSGKFNITSSGTLDVQPYLNGLTGTALTSANVCDNQWHFIAVSRSGSTLSLYVDGVQVATASDYDSTGVTTTHSVNTGFTGAFIGTEIGWNSSMTAGQMAAWYATK
jgi:hypothetical protein